MTTGATEAEHTVLLTARFVIGHDGADHVVYDHGVVVYRGDTILFCGQEYRDPVDETLDLGLSIISPGFIDLDADIDTDHSLIDVAFPRDPRDAFRMGARFRTVDPYTDEDLRVRQTYSLAQLLKNGITTAMPIEGELFHGWSQSYREFEIMADVALNLGCRLYVGPSFKSSPGPGMAVDAHRSAQSFQDAVEFVEQFDGLGDGLLRGFMNPCQINCTSEELLLRASAFAQARGMPMRLHACEGLHEWDLIRSKGGESTIAYFEELGLLSPRLLIPHCLVARDREIALLAERGVSVIHTPIAEINFGAALVSFAKYRHYGVNIAMGTDAQPDDMIQNMRLAWNLDRQFYRREIYNVYPDRGPAYNLLAGQAEYPRLTGADVFRAATTRGAKALGRDDLGRLSRGAKADIIVIGLDDLAVGPYEDPIRTLIMSCVGNNVTHTIVNGKMLMRDRRLLGIDERALLGRAQEVYERFLHLYQAYDEQQRPIETFFPPEFRCV
jgi:cytosine/adenosine deaminase-related metal-dependent hydrolase